VHRVPGGEVILDALDNQLNELRVTGDEHGDEQIADLFLGVLVG